MSDKGPRKANPDSLYICDGCGGAFASNNLKPVGLNLSIISKKLWEKADKKKPRRQYKCFRCRNSINRRNSL